MYFRLLVHRLDKSGQYSPDSSAYMKLAEQKTTWGSSIARTLLLALLMSKSEVPLVTTEGGRR